MYSKLARLKEVGVKLPIIQAGMPGIAGPELASAVSKSGGIGTLGLQDKSLWPDALRQTKSLSNGHPYAANLLLPYVRKKHIEAVIEQETPIVTLFWGKNKKLVSGLKTNGIFTIQQVASLDEAYFALDAGIDALIVQGYESGGHLRGKLRLDDLLPDIVVAADQIPVFAAGGMYSSTDVSKAIDQGAVGVASGTRFLLTHESNAHDEYKEKLLQADQTVVTTLFGLGWPTPHRVVKNQAIENWCDESGKVPAWLQYFNACFGFTRKLLPFKAEAAKSQSTHLPVLSSAALEKTMPSQLLECTALYAGEKVASISDLLSSKEVVEELARGLKPCESMTTANAQ